MPQQTAPQVYGPTRKLKNCEQWALYEPPGASEGARFCNGGWVRGEYFEECPSRSDCRRSTRRREEEEAEEEQSSRHLPVMNPERSFGSHVVGSTPNLPKFRTSSWEDHSIAAYPSAVPAKATSRKTTQTQQPQAQPGAYPSGHPMFPTPIIPPTAHAPAMRTPFAAPTPFHHGGITPTFLPAGKNDIWQRLAMNVMQGFVGSAGWHVYDFARTVDMFG